MNEPSFTSTIDPDAEFSLTNILPSSLVNLIFHYYFDPDEFLLHDTIDAIPNDTQQAGDKNSISLNVIRDNIRITFINSVLTCTLEKDHNPMPMSKVIDHSPLQKKKENPKHGSVIAINGDFSLHSKSINKKKFRIALLKKDYATSYFEIPSAPQIATISHRDQRVAIICKDNYLYLEIHGDKHKVDIGACKPRGMAFSTSSSSVHLCGEDSLYMYIPETQQLAKTEIEYPGAMGSAISNDGNVFVVYKENKLLIYKKMPKNRVTPYFPCD